MTVGEALEAKRERILGQLFEYRNRDLQTTEQEVKQFLLGYFNLVVASAGGNDDIREEYLHAVVPGIRAGGMSLAMVMDGMVRVAMVLVAETEPEHHDWLIKFNADYTFRLSELWEA
jgi:hypothetical protein